ncbi:hypothetical protein DPMN_042278 [Dreissena polymorpha]|uniref:Uncharacterized protein n=1 Tax=Dreissena polymorpha TaxID=45954 RepID=A0A9D4HWX9_DREPO|nr:hypothetical protein DPMN_042278 [Dreissena polymorpha]
MTTDNKMTLTFVPDTTILQMLSAICGVGQLLSQENTVPRQTVYTVSYQYSTINQTNDGTAKSDMVSNTLSEPTLQDDITNQTTAINKPIAMSNPVSNSQAMAPDT